MISWTCSCSWLKNRSDISSKLSERTASLSQVQVVPRWGPWEGGTCWLERPWDTFYLGAFPACLPGHLLPACSSALGSPAQEPGFSSQPVREETANSQILLTKEEQGLNWWNIAQNTKFRVVQSLNPQQRQSTFAWQKLWRALCETGSGRGLRLYSGTAPSWPPIGCRARVNNQPTNQRISSQYQT